MKRSTVAIALVLGMGIGAAGCASGTPSSPPTTSAAETPSPSPDETMTPTPSEPAEAEADRIVVSAETIVVLDSDGAELASYDYFQDTAEVVDGLTELFGREPVDTPFEGDTHSPAGTQWSWDGFSILDDDREPTPPHTPNHLVDITATEVDGIALETVDGFGVGTSADDVLAAPDAEPYPETGIIQVDAVPLDFDDPICPEGGCTLSVRLVTDEPGDVIERMLAPAPNFGA